MGSVENRNKILLFNLLKFSIYPTYLQYSDAVSIEKAIYNGYKLKDQYM